MAFRLYIIGDMQAAYAQARTTPAIRNNRQVERNILAPRNIHKAKGKIVAQMRIIRAHTLRYCAKAKPDVRLLRDPRLDVTLLREGNFRPVRRNIIARTHFAAHVL